MKFMRRTEEYSLLDNRRNKDILKEFNIVPVGRKLAHCNGKRLNHTSRIKDIRCP
jgi:hypothetical protein